MMMTVIPAFESSYISDAKLIRLTRPWLDLNGIKKPYHFYGALVLLQLGCATAH